MKDGEGNLRVMDGVSYLRSIRSRYLVVGTSTYILTYIHTSTCRIFRPPPFILRILTESGVSYDPVARAVPRLPPGWLRTGSITVQ
jgi:hypothetical protein